jgi:ABC-type Fe3+ transport system substrate-binding protein
MNYIDINDTIYAITEKYPETVDIFVARGFPQMAEYAQCAGYGKLVSLKTALEMRKINSELFVGLLNEAIGEHREGADLTLSGAQQNGQEESLTMTGLLPCPVRIPILEEFNSFSSSYRKQHNRAIDAELKAASVGTQWVEEHIGSSTSVESLPDIFISAGFDLFFDRQRIGRLREQNAFTDLLDWKGENSAFAGLDLKDPAGGYSIIAVVPAVFLVNTQELGDRPVPKSWDNLLNGDFSQSVSLPVGDFDLFNAILLTIRGRYGDRSVEELGRVMLQALHPSQMVKSDRMKNARPAVTIMPYFFTKTIREGGPMQAVWPEDGAIVSPIFMLTKRGKEEELKPVVDFFGSKKIGEVLAHQGLFPSLNPEVDNRLAEGTPFMWLGWDYIKSRDLSKEISASEEIFKHTSSLVDMTEESA